MWVFVTLFAAACQSFRMAYQNTLAQREGYLHATMARSLFGLPLVTGYLCMCMWVFGWVTFHSGFTFFVAASVCAVMQVAATYLLLRVFQSGSFVLGNMLAKTEAVLAALVGVVLLNNGLTPLGWTGVIVGVLGAVVMSIKAAQLTQLFSDVSFVFGLASGLCFGVTSVTAAMASQALDGHVVTRAGVTLWYVLALQSVFLCGVQMFKTRDLFAPMRGDLSLSLKVGALSSLGSIGWFTGFALVNPALVKTLGQIELVGTLYFSKVRFGETISPQQWIGGGMVLASIGLVTFAGV